VLKQYIEISSYGSFSASKFCTSNYIYLSKYKVKVGEKSQA